MRNSLLFGSIIIAALSPFSVANAEQKPDSVVKESLTAIEKKDMEAIEGLRGRIKPPHIAPIVKTWKTSLPWPTKDAYVALLMDQLDPLLKPMMEDALSSPTVDTRAYAVCILRNDLKMCATFIDAKGWIVPAKVDVAVKKYRSEKTRR